MSGFLDTNVVSEYNRQQAAMPAVKRWLTLQIAWAAKAGSGMASKTARAAIRPIRWQWAALF
jgi:hypothetical protein